MLLSPLIQHSFGVCISLAKRNVIIIRAECTLTEEHLYTITKKSFVQQTVIQHRLSYTLQVKFKNKNKQI
jgi:hypothetical protein